MCTDVAGKDVGDINTWCCAYLLQTHKTPLYVSSAFINEWTWKHCAILHTSPDSLTCVCVSVCACLCVSACVCVFVRTHVCVCVFPINRLWRGGITLLGSKNWDKQEGGSFSDFCYWVLFTLKYLTDFFFCLNLSCTDQSLLGFGGFKHEYYQ